jgi:hypothetical protein
MQMIVDTLPVLANKYPDLQKLEELAKMEIDIFVEPTIEQQLEEFSGHARQEPSGIIEGLYYSLRYSQEDYNRISRPNYTGKLRHDNMVRDDIADYYENRVQQQADDIVQFIDGLIQRDHMPSEKFGNYKQIKTAIDKSDGKKKATYLNMLRIAGLTVIPQDIKFEHVEIIEPSITSSIRTQ